MLKATSSRNGGCQVEGEGSIMEQLSDLLNIIQSMHNGTDTSMWIFEGGTA